MTRKKLTLFALMTLMGVLSVNAQSDDYKSGIFNHVSIGASASLFDGIGFDVAAPITKYAALRAGVAFWPKISVKDNFDIDDNNPSITESVDVKAKLNVFDFKFLADLYPIKGCSFHLTAGAYIGDGKVVTATNTSMFIKDPAKYGKLGLKLGDYRITTDKNGYVTADAKVNNFKPYVGIGFGRAVSKKRLNVSCDFGVKFWGEPRLGAITKDDWGNNVYHHFKSTDLDEYDDEDLKDYLEKAEDFKVCPVVSIRLSGRIF